MSKVPWALPVKPGEYMITIVLAFILLWPREIDQYLFSVSHGLQHWFPATYRTLRPSQIHFRHPVVYQIRTVIVLICLAICFLAFQKPLKGPNPTYRKKKKALWVVCEISAVPSALSVNFIVFLNSVHKILYILNRRIRIWFRD